MIFDKDVKEILECKDMKRLMREYNNEANSSYCRGVIEARLMKLLQEQMTDYPAILCPSSRP